MLFKITISLTCIWSHRILQHCVLGGHISQYQEFMITFSELRPCWQVGSTRYQWNTFTATHPTQEIDRNDSQISINLLAYIIWVNTRGRTGNAIYELT